jgi:hypothetical protein
MEMFLQSVADGEYNRALTILANNLAKEIESFDKSGLEDKVSDILAMIGTMILWVFWP